jgi:hypothetical protein
MRRTTLAPRTVRHVKTTLQTMLHEAVVDELIPSNPCVFKRGELPQKIDKDPRWRADAVFTRQEVEQLLSDERIPEDQTVFNALIFLTGMRTGRAERIWFIGVQYDTLGGVDNDTVLCPLNPTSSQCRP